MKKIVLLSVFFLTILGCSKSKSDEIITNTTPTELVGSWKLVGYYTDIVDPVTNSNYYPVTNGDILKFGTDGKFDNVGDAINPDGSYSVSSDLVITRNYYANSLNPSFVLKDKINLLNANVLEFGANGATLSDTYRYSKINSTPTVSGKK